MDRQRTGQRGEDLAAAYLAERGYTVLERNYRSPERAEVDLIGRAPGGELVFVEVKARRGLGFGRPEEAVTSAKQEQLAEAAKAYLHEQALQDTPCRFDVVAIVLGAGGPQIEHFRDAFWAA